MSESRNVPLFSVPKDSSKDVKSSRCLRLSVDLEQSTKEAFPEISYADLVRAEKEKHVHARKINGSHPAASTPLDNDDSREMLELARKFEEKYGCSNKKKHKKRSRDISDLGFGYDDNDSFIDNSEMVDEAVPSNVRTQHGGFYINAGTLQLERVSDDSSQPAVYPQSRRKRLRPVSSDSEDDEDHRRREDSASDEDDASSDGAEDERPLAASSSSIVQKRSRLGRPPKVKTDGSSLLLKKKKRAIDGLLKSKKQQQERQAGRSVKQLLEQKRSRHRLQQQQLKQSEQLRDCAPSVVTVPAPPLSNSETSPSEHMVAVIAAVASGDTTKVKSDAVATPATSIDAVKRTPSIDAVKHTPSTSTGTESGGGDGSSGSDSSSGSGDSSGDEGGTDGSDEESEEPSAAEDKGSTAADGAGRVDGQEHQLPAGLSGELLRILAEIRAAADAANRTGEGKRKFFSPDINRMLLSIELHCQHLLRKERQRVFLHLADHLPCGMQTLVKRAKQLVLEAEKDFIRKPLHRLRDAVRACMPVLKQRHEEECKQAMEIRELPIPAHLTDDNDKETSVKPSLPKKQFKWTESTRSRLKRVVEVRAQSFKMLAKRLPAVEEFLKTFLEHDVLTIWEPGWMSIAELMKHSLPIFQEEIKNKTMPLKLSSSSPKKPSRSGSPAVSSAASSPRPSAVAASPAAVAGPPPAVPTRVPVPSAATASSPTSHASGVPTNSVGTAAAPASNGTAAAHPACNGQPRSLDDLWSSFNQDSTVDEIAARISQLLRDVQAKLMAKMLEDSSPQNDAEISKYRDELRRLQVAMTETAKMQAKDKKKKARPTLRPTLDVNGGGGGGDFTSNTPVSQASSKVSNGVAKLASSSAAKASSQNVSAMRDGSHQGSVGEKAAHMSISSAPEKPVDMKRSGLSSGSGKSPLSDGKCGGVDGPDKSSDAVVNKSAVDSAVFASRNGVRPLAAVGEKQRLKEMPPGCSVPCLVSAAAVGRSSPEETLRQSSVSSSGASSPLVPSPQRPGSVTPEKTPPASLSAAILRQQQMSPVSASAMPPPTTITSATSQPSTCLQQSQQRHPSPRKAHLLAAAVRSPSPPAPVVSQQLPAAEGETATSARSFRQINDAEVHDAVASIIDAVEAAADLSVCLSSSPPPPVADVARVGPSVSDPAESPTRRSDSGSAEFRRPSQEPLSTPPPAHRQSAESVWNEQPVQAPTQLGFCSEDDVEDVFTAQNLSLSQRTMPVGSVQRCIGAGDARRPSGNKMKSPGSVEPADLSMSLHDEFDVAGGKQPRRGSTAAGADGSSSAPRKVSQDRIGDELDLMMNELMNYSGQRAREPSAPPPTSPAASTSARSTPAGFARSSSSSNILQMAAQQADIFSGVESSSTDGVGRQASSSSALSQPVVSSARASVAALSESAEGLLAHLAGGMISQHQQQRAAAAVGFNMPAVTASSVPSSPLRLPHSGFTNDAVTRSYGERHHVAPSAGSRLAASPSARTDYSGVQSSAALVDEYSNSLQASLRQPPGFSPLQYPGLPVASPSAQRRGYPSLPRGSIPSPSTSSYSDPVLSSQQLLRYGSSSTSPRGSLPPPSPRSHAYPSSPKASVPLSPVASYGSIQQPSATSLAHPGFGAAPLVSAASTLQQHQQQAYLGLSMGVSPASARDPTSSLHQMSAQLSASLYSDQQHRLAAAANAGDLGSIFSPAAHLSSSHLNPAAHLSRSHLNPATHLSSSHLNPAANLSSSHLNPAAHLSSSHLNPAAHLSSSHLNPAAHLSSSHINPAAHLSSSHISSAAQMLANSQQTSQQQHQQHGHSSRQHQYPF